MDKIITQSKAYLTNTRTQEKITVTITVEVATKTEFIIEQINHWEIMNEKRAKVIASSYLDMGVINEN